MIAHRRRRAFFLLDVAISIVILSVMAVVLVSVVSHQRAASQRLGDARTAQHFAEQVLLDLHQGRVAPESPANLQLQIDPITGGQPIAGFSWTRVTVRNNRMCTVLYGLAKSTGKAQP